MQGPYIQCCLPDGRATSFMKGTRKHSSLVSRGFKQESSGGQDISVSCLLWTDRASYHEIMPMTDVMGTIRRTVHKGISEHRVQQRFTSFGVFGKQHRLSIQQAVTTGASEIRSFSSLGNEIVSLRPSSEIYESYQNTFT